MKLLKSILVAHRFEFTPVTIALCLSFMVINLNNFKELLSPVAILTFIVVNLATYWGSIYNVCHDYELDKKNQVKSRLANAVDDIGWNRIKYFKIIEPIIFLGIGAYITYLTNNYLSFILLLVGTFFAIAYSREPLRFKRRGILNSISLFIIIMFFPPLYGYLLMNDNIINNIDLILIAGIALVEYGLGLYYTTVDYSEDKDDNIKTPSVHLGVVISVALSIILVLIGILCLVYGYHIKGSYLSLVVAVSGSLIPMIWMSVYLFRALDNNKLEVLIKKNEGFIPLWVALSAFMVLIANCIHLF